MAWLKPKIPQKLRNIPENLWNRPKNLPRMGEYFPKIFLRGVFWLYPLHTSGSMCTGIHTHLRVHPIQYLCKKFVEHFFSKINKRRISQKSPSSKICKNPPVVCAGNPFCRRKAKFFREISGFSGFFGFNRD